MAVASNVFLAVERAKHSELGEEDIKMCIFQFSKELSKYSIHETPSNLLIRRLIWTMWLLLYRILPFGLILVFTFQRLYLLYSSDPCLVSQPVLSEFAMPIVDCSRCQNITGAVHMDHITARQFMNNYAFSLQPLLMKGAALDWPAISTFSYKYFKALYMKRPEAMDHDKTEGQFFPYSSGIHKLDEFIALDNDTAALKGDRWYIGW